jgi:dolichyl-phosphate beta-glucosyltransferase
MNHGPLRRHAPTVLAALVFGATVVLAWLALNVDNVENASREAGVAGVVVFFAAYVVAAMVLLPSTALNLAAGAIFGPVLGLFVASAAALVSAFLTLGARRLPGLDALRRRVHERWPTLADRLDEGGTSYVVALRLFPIIPYGLVSYAASIGGVNRRAFALGSIIGTPIGLAPFVFLGASGERALSGGTLLPLVGSLAMLAVLVIAGAVHRRRDLTETERSFPSAVPSLTLDPAWQGRRGTGETETVELSVIFPSYNEAERLPPTLLDAITYLRERGDSFEVIVADDGSSDGTPAIVGQVAQLCPEVRLVASPENFGKGSAVRTGVANSRGRRVVFSDADGSTPISELERLEVALDAGADIAIGSRAVAGPGISRETQAHRKIMGRIFNGIVSTLLLPGVKDTQCGFKMFDREAADAVFSRQRNDGFSFDVEILFIARRLRLETTEVGVNWFDAPGSKVNLVTDSIRMLRDTMVILVRDLTGRYAYGSGERDSETVDAQDRTTPH